MCKGTHNTPGVRAVLGACFAGAPAATGPLETRALLLCHSRLAAVCGRFQWAMAWETLPSLQAAQTDWR